VATYKITRHDERTLSIQWDKRWNKGDQPTFDGSDVDTAYVRFDPQTGFQYGTMDSNGHMHWLGEPFADDAPPEWKTGFQNTTHEEYAMRALFEQTLVAADEYAVAKGGKPARDEAQRLHDTLVQARQLDGGPESFLRILSDRTGPEQEYFLQTKIDSPVRFGIGHPQFDQQNPQGN
jgi:hypothetical protein